MLDKIQLRLYLKKPNNEIVFRKHSFRSNIFVSLLPTGENGITGLKANMLRPVPKIESINLEQNAIKFIHPQAFSGAKQLMLLNLYGNHITIIPLRGFQVRT